MNFWDSRIAQWSRTRGATVAFSESRLAVSFRLLDQQSSRVAEFLKAHGVTAGDRVLSALPQSSSSAILLSALLRADIAALSIARLSTSANLLAFISKVSPAALIVMAADANDVTATLAKASIESDVTTFASCDTSNTGDDLALVRPKVRPTVSSPVELGWLLATSGSTGTPRIVMIGKDNLRARASGEIRDFTISEGDRILNNLTFAHDLGLNQFLTTLAAGVSLTIQNRPFISSLADVLTRNEHDGMTGTPSMWQQLMRLERGPFPTPRYVTVSGGSLSQNNLEALSRNFPRAEIVRTYGQSETFRTLLNRGIADESLGHPIDGVAAFLIDSNGHACPRGMAGELIHQGEGSMLGYFGEPMESAAKDFRPGVRTGDIFVQNSDGTFTYVGRRDDMIKRFDTRLHLGEVEASIARYPDVERVAVVSRPSVNEDVRQELMCAFVTSRPNSKMDLDLLTRHCRETMEAYKIPDTIRIIETFPMTESYKIDRQELKKLWSESETK